MFTVIEPGMIMNARPFIELKSISYGYPAGKEKVLDKLTFSLGHESCGLIGPNGCGKTTLFHIIMGLLIPEEGTVIHRGISLGQQKDFVLLRKEVGFLFQNSDDQLFSPTVVEDIAFGPLNLGFSSKEALDITRETLELLGIAGFENRLTHRLSGGEKKLVALATILAMKPKLLLLDEPTNNLDPTTRLRLIEILQQLSLPKVIISHDWDFLAETTKTLYTLDHGHLHQCNQKQLHTHRHIHPYGDTPHQHTNP